MLRPKVGRVEGAMCTRLCADDLQLGPLGYARLEDRPDQGCAMDVSSRDTVASRNALRNAPRNAISDTWVTTSTTPDRAQVRDGVNPDSLRSTRVGGYGNIGEWFTGWSESVIQSQRPAVRVQLEQPDRAVAPKRPSLPR